MTASHPKDGALVSPIQPAPPSERSPERLEGNPVPPQLHAEMHGGTGPKTPAAGTREAGPAAGRTFTLEMPAGLKTLSLNDRHHWSEKNRRAAELKKAAWAMAISRRVPHLERVSLVVEYQPPDKRHRDADNVPAASGKYLIDGIVAASVLPDDESPRYVADIRYRLGPVYPLGRLVLHITEVTT